LDQKCKTDGHVTVGNVLEEVLECANGVHKAPDGDEDWTGIDGKFKTDLHKIWTLEEPENLYVESLELLGSARFTEMLGKLQHKIAIEKPEDIFDAKGEPSYAKLLHAIKMSMDKVVIHKRWLKSANLGKADGHVVDAADQVSMCGINMTQKSTFRTR
jgi:hypothetical protein